MIQMKWIGKLFLCVSFCFLLIPSIFAQKKEEGKKTKKDSIWDIGLGIGVDGAQLLQLNPRVGSGQNRVGFGGAINFSAKYKKKRAVWDNTFVSQFGVQRLGAGVIGQGTLTKVPFQKSIDEIRMDSRLGIKATGKSKLSYASGVNFISQIAPTYKGPASFPGNFLKKLDGKDTRLQSLFFSPAQISVSAGMDFRPNDKWAIYYSPLAGRFIIVNNDEIAFLGVHGNPVEKSSTGTIVSAENIDKQLGTLLRLSYKTKFWENKFTYASAIQLYSNYLKDFKYVDLQYWTNDLSMKIIKGFQLSLTVNAYYDRDVLVQITDYSQPNGVRGLGRAVSINQQMLMKYALTF